MKRRRVPTRALLAVLFGAPLLTGAVGASHNSAAWYLHPFAPIVRAIERGTTWRAAAYSDLSGRLHLPWKDAEFLAAHVSEVGDGYISYSGPSWTRTWNTVALPLPSGTDTVDAFPGAYGLAGKALHDPSYSCSDSVLAGHASQNVWFVDTAGSRNADTLALPGTFPAAIDSAVAHPSDCNYVHFRKGGWHYFPRSWGDSYNATLRNIYIAGQTAPGGGVGFNDDWRWRGGSVPGTHDVIMRYVTWMPQQAFGFFWGRGGISRILIDHATFAWAANGGGSGLLPVTCDTATSGSPSDGPCSGWTFQHLLLYQPDSAHATISMTQSTPKDNPGASEVLNYRNLYVGPGWRTPSLGTGVHHRVQESVSYNRWGTYNGLWVWRYSSSDVVGYYSKPGPATQTNTLGRGGTIRWYMTPSSICPGGGVDNCGNDLTLDPLTIDSTLYVKDVQCHNNGWAVDTTEASIWSECVIQDDGSTLVPTGYMRTSPLAMVNLPPVVTMTPTVVNEVADSSGNDHALADSGRFVFRRNSRDSLIIQQFHDSTGPSHGFAIDTTTLPTLAAGTPPADADGDGMPDAFESRYFGSATGGSPTADPDGDGYTNYVEYINGTDPTVADGTSAGSAPSDTATYERSPKPIFAALLSTPASSALVRDTFEHTGHLPAFDSFPLYHGHRIIYNGDSSKAIITYCDTLSGHQVFVIDSQAVRDSLIAWLRDTLLARDSLPPGCS